MKEILIKVSDELLSFVYRNGFVPSEKRNELNHAILQCVELPKGHGKLIDVDKVDWQAGVFLGYDGEPLPVIHKIATIEMLRDWQDAVVEADKGE